MSSISSSVSLIKSFAQAILNLMWLLVGYRHSLPPTSHCVTTSLLAETRAKIIPVSPPRFYTGCPSCCNPPYFQAWDQHRTCWLAYPVLDFTKRGYLVTWGIWNVDMEAYDERIVNWAQNKWRSIANGRHRKRNDGHSQKSTEVMVRSCPQT